MEKKLRLIIINSDSKVVYVTFYLCQSNSILSEFLFSYLYRSKQLSFRKITGFKIQIKGRLIKRQSRSQVRVYEKGTIPLQSVSAKINYSLTHVNTTYGIFGIKVWIFD